MAQHYTSGRFKSFLSGGNLPNVSGRLYTFDSGTTTHKDAFTDATLGMPCTYVADGFGKLYIALDARGEAQVWLGAGAYTFVEQTSTGVAIDTTDGVEDAATAADTLRADLAAAGGADLVDGSQASPGVAMRTIGDRARDWWHIKDFKVSGDGATWHQAIQRAADSKERVFFDPVSYDIGDEVNPQTGARLYGAGSYTAAASTHSTEGVTTLNYVGAGGLNSAMVRISNAAVGVVPSVSADANMQNITFSGFTLLGNGLVQFGLYGVRCTQGNMLDFLTVVGTLKHAFWMGLGFGGGAMRGWTAFKNQGASFSLGMDDFNWAALIPAVSNTFEQCVLESPFAYFGGCDSSGSPLNVFDESGSGDVNAGYRIGGGRGLQIINLQAAQCDGPGVYMKPKFDPILINGGYVEFCGRSSHSTRQWATWYEGDASGLNPYLKWQSLRFGGTPAHKMTGTAPSRLEGGPVFENCPIIGAVDAIWSNYRLIDCDRSVAFVGGGFRPTNFDRMRSTDSSMTISGSVRFTTTAGVVSGLRKNGVISGVSRTSAGLFVASLSETYTHGFQAIFGVPVSGWEICEVSRTSTSLTFTTLSTGVATDPTTFNVQLMLMGDYD